MKPVVPKTVSVGNKVHGTSSDQWKTTWSASHGFCCSCSTQCYSFPALNHRETKETAEKCARTSVFEGLWYAGWKMTWVAKWMLHTLSLKGHWFKNIDLGTFTEAFLFMTIRYCLSLGYVEQLLVYVFIVLQLDSALYKKDAVDVIFIIRANVKASLFCNLEWPLLFRHSLSFILYSTVNKPDLTKTKVHTFATRHKTIHINLQFTK